MKNETESVFTFTPEQQLERLYKVVADLNEELIKLRRDIPTKETMRAVMQEMFAADLTEQSKLVSDASKALRLLIDTGVLTQEQVNEAIQ